MKLTELVDFSIGLAAVPAQSAGFSVPLHLSDTTDVPIDKRYRIVSKSDYASILTAGSAAEDWAGILWGQDYNVAEAYIGRWVSAASSPHFIMPDFGTDYTTLWPAVTVGDFAVTDGTNTDEVATGTMAAITSAADICAVIQTALQAIVAPNITGLDTATCAVDALGRIVITNSTTGAAAATITVQAPAGGAGTDITTANYLNVATGFGVAGLDAEDPDDAMAAILALDDTPFVIHLDDASATAEQQSALAVACSTYKKMYELVVTDADAKDSGSSTDIAALLFALANNNCHGVYTEHLDSFPNAALNGQIYPLAEGSASFANNAIRNTVESGLDGDGVSTIALTAAERSALDGKNCDYLIRPTPVAVTCRTGLTFGAVEVRHRVGYYWAEKRAAEEIYAYLLVNKVTTFSDIDIVAIVGIITKYIDILVERKCAEAGYTVNIPLAADISLIEKATHTLTLSDVAAIISQYAINDVVSTASATV